MHWYNERSPTKLENSYARFYSIATLNRTYRKVFVPLNRKIIEVAEYQKTAKKLVNYSFFSNPERFV